ncbi:hypothetical protein Tco_0951985 [Tanacetum coccineum]|uniref:Uncharacterized protein n=1 Tax=Tanacetum coccineum TaxID=301880 RepID=A0ABQ5DW29_9ASTR
MTTSSVNNSVFHDIIENKNSLKPKLHWIGTEHPTFGTFQLKTREYTMSILFPAAPVAQPGEQIPPQTLQLTLHGLQGAKEVALKYSKQAEQKLLQTGEFHTSASRRRINRILPASFRNIPCNMHGMGKTVNELHAMLKLHEESYQRKMLILHFMQYEQEGFRKTKRINRTKLVEEEKVKERNTMGYAHNNVHLLLNLRHLNHLSNDKPSKDAICHQSGKLGTVRRQLSRVSHRVERKRRS